MADLRFEPGSSDILIRPLTDIGAEWVGKYIDRAPAADGTVTVGFSDAPEIERAAREDGLTVGELAL